MPAVFIQKAFNGTVNRLRRCQNAARPPWKGILTYGSRKNAQTDKKMGGRERGGEECPGVKRQPFILVWSMTVGFAYMNPTLIDWYRCDMFQFNDSILPGCLRNFQCML